MSNRSTIRAQATTFDRPLALKDAQQNTANDPKNDPDRTIQQTAFKQPDKIDPHEAAKPSTSASPPSTSAPSPSSGGSSSSPASVLGQMMKPASSGGVAGVVVVAGVDSAATNPATAQRSRASWPMRTGRCECHRRCERGRCCWACAGLGEPWVWVGGVVGSDGLGGGQFGDECGECGDQCRHEHCPECGAGGRAGSRGDAGGDDDTGIRRCSGRRRRRR